MVELNDPVAAPELSLPQCVTPPITPTSKSLLGKRLFDDIFVEEIFHAQKPAKKCKLDLDLKTAMRTPGVKRKRRVGFAEDGVSVTRVARREKTLWYSRGDLAKMKDTAKRECRQLNLDSTLAPAYGLPNKSNTDEKHFPSLVSLPLE